MNRNLRKFSALMLAGAMLGGSAMADSITFTGTVDAKSTVEVYASIGGIVGTVNYSAGDHVNSGDVLAQLKTTKVYASESGTVTGVFAEPGESADTVSQRYGAVMYIEGESVYTIAASTENAYNSTATKFVSVGEEVYLSCYSDSSKHTGTGRITSIQGTDYTVEVTSGSFLVGETVSVYRSESYSSSTRIGRGELSRTAPTSVTGTGSIVSVAVQDGDTVQRGDLLFETLDGSFDGYYMSGTDLTANTDGVIASMQVSQGSNVQKDQVIAVIYPEDAMRVTGQVSESNLDSIKVGDPVTVELLWNEDYDVSYEGVVTGISMISNTSESGMDGDTSVTYNVYIDFTPDENTRYGMTATITTLDAEETAAEDESEEDLEEEETEQEETVENVQ